MPTIQITICARCGLKTCDGGVWKYISIISKADGSERIDKIPQENLGSCSMDFGRSRFKSIRDKSVGDVVRLEFDNWSDPSSVLVEKIED